MELPVVIVFDATGYGSMQLNTIALKNHNDEYTLDHILREDILDMLDDTNMTYYSLFYFINLSLRLCLTGRMMYS